MEQHSERVSSRLGGAGPQRLGAQPGEPGSSESRRGGSKRSTVKSEKEKEKEGFQARSRRHAEEPGQVPPPLDLEKITKQRVESATSRSPRPEVGDVLVAKYAFTARCYEELTLAKGDEVVLIENDDEFGDGWFLGEIPSTGKSGIFPATYTGIKAPRVLSKSEDSPTIPTELWAGSPEPDAGLKPEIVRRNSLNNFAGPVCVSCGAGWDPRTGCSRSCGGTQDGLGNHRGMDEKLPQKGKTRLPAHLTSKKPGITFGYTLSEEDAKDFVPETLGRNEIDYLLALSELDHNSDLEMDATGSQPGNHVDEGHEYLNAVGGTTNDEPASRPGIVVLSPRVPLSGPARLPTSPSSYDDDNNEDNDTSNNEVLVIEEQTPPASLHADSDGGAGSTDSIASYSAMFSAESREQPTNTRLDQSLHPDQRGKHESAAVQGKNANREERFMDSPQTIEPGAKTLTDTGSEDSLDDQNQKTRNQAEEHLDEHSADTIQNVSRPKDCFKSLDRSSQEDRPVLLKKDSFAMWVAKWATNTLWPPSNGSQRIWYFCGCGEYTYIDVKELEPGGLESEWRTISESSEAVTRAHSPQRDARSASQLPATPSPVHLDPNPSRNMASPNSPSQETPREPRPYLTPEISPGPSGTARDPMFLLVCINGKAYKSLAELRCLGIDDSYNDELLVRGILSQYEQARKGCQWTIDLLLPKRMLPSGLLKLLKSIWENVPVSVRRLSFIRESPLGQFISEWWNRWASDVSPWAPLHIIDTADFVEFELVPHPEGKEAFPSHFTSGRWPAPDNKQYRYRPVPMKCVKTMNLWHMRRPGPHTEVYWYNTVPKKVDGELYRPSGTVENVIGYGVRINERLNDVLVLWWSLIFIMVTGVFVYVYSNYTSDNSSAFGMGAYLVAAFTVYIQLQYAWWKRT